MLVDAQIDVRADKTDRSIPQHEMSSSYVIAAEVINVICGIVWSVVATAQNTNDRVVTVCDDPSPGGCPAKAIVSPRSSFSDDECIAESVSEVADLDSAVLEESSFAVAGNVRCIDAFVHFADSKYPDVIRDGQFSQIRGGFVLESSRRRLGQRRTHNGTPPREQLEPERSPVIPF